MQCQCPSLQKNKHHQERKAPRFFPQNQNKIPSFSIGSASLTYFLFYISTRYIPSIRFSSSCVLATPVSRDHEEELTIERSLSRSLSFSSPDTSGFITFRNSLFLKSPAIVATETLVALVMRVSACLTGR